MIGQRSSQSPSRFGAVDAKRLGRCARLPGANNFATGADLLRAEAERIGVKRQQDPSVGEARQSGCGAAEGLHRTLLQRVVLDRFVAIPFGLRPR